MKRLSLLFALLLPALAACQPAAHLRAPDDFAALPTKGDVVYRAANPDGIVLAIRREANEPQGSLKFWSTMLDGKLRDAGYKQDGPARDAKTGTGLVGRELRYARTEGGRTYKYWVNVFVSGDRVWLVEAGGDAEKIDAEATDWLAKAMASATFG